jgi:hypothetical protein
MSPAGSAHGATLKKARLFWSKQQHDSLSGVKSYSWYFVIFLVLFFLSPD